MLQFQDAEKARDAITASTSRKIKSLYKSWANDIEDMATYYSHKTTSSAPLIERQMKELKKQLVSASKDISNKIKSEIQNGMLETGKETMKSNAKWLSEFGFNYDDILDATVNIPKQIVNNLVTGQIYSGGWNLSKSIWGDKDAVLQDAYTVVAKGMAENLPAYDIAKELSAYVNPDKKLKWNYTMKDGKKIYKKQVDYSAQRLARTLIQHSYQQNFIAVTKNNPFVTDYIWRSTGSRACSLCKERDGQHYKKNELPMDHPNGMCTMVPNVEDKFEDKIADWFKNPSGTYPDIDKFADTLGYKNNAIDSTESFINKYGTSTKSLGGWYQSMPSVQKAEAKALKEKDGISFADWYKKNIFVGDESAFAGKPKKKAKAFIFDREAWANELKQNDLNKMHRWTSDWTDALSDEEHDGVRTYTGGAYSNMNRYLRGITEHCDYKREIENAKNAMAKASLPEDVIVRRGSDFRSFKGIFNLKDDVKIATEDRDNYIGTIVNDKGFMSTSPNPKGGFDDDIEYVIKVPKGSKAMYVAPISMHQGEQELLIDAGTKFVIEDLDIVENRVKKVYMTAIK